ncbi:GSCFA domain-containing protein [Pseudodesulfovibrio indicus]|uniref:GSCFA domain-containing protein n=1 Tax=Pseudodesulfovibrio indicus TaxID=1716143 RepID=UPI00293138B5|nr:GSCFA domain-containing protein [Pseudodesulfovibrio indicus]
MTRDRERFQFHLLSHGECLGFVEDAIALVRARNPKARFLLTTSPIPLDRTFTDDDVIVANLHSKSKLRSVCGELAATGEVEYFPSFESVMLTKDWDIWYPDLRHVEGFFVGEIVNRLCDAYFDSSESARLYQRSFCCKINEESVELVRAALALEEKAEYHSRLGGLYRLAGKLDEAIESFRNANRLDPSDWETYRHLAILEEKKGRFQEARCWLNRAEGHWPADNGELHLIQSRLSNKSHDRAAAVEFMRRALDADRSMMRNKLSQGQVLLSVEQVDRAALVAKEVINYNLSIPDSHREAGCLAQAHLLLSRAHERAGRLDEAVTEAGKAAALDDGDSEIRVHLAALCQR